jgi:hypothetical protein
MTPRREAWIPVALFVGMGASFIAMPMDVSTPVGKAHAVMALFVAAHAVAAVAAVGRASVRARIAIAISLLAGGAGLNVVWLAGFRPAGLMVSDDWPRAVLGITASAIAATTLARRRIWGRWLALAIAVCALVSTGINLARWAFVADVWKEWVHARVISFSGGAVLAATLAGPAVRDAFLAREGAQLWASPHRLVASVRRAVFANVVAIAMLLVYAWTQPLSPVTAWTAQALAVLLLVAVGLAAARKVVGAILLVIGGLGLAIQTVATVWIAHRSFAATGAVVAYYYVVFWAPAAALSLAAAHALARPVVALLRQR